jgi:hypothetical protein
LTTPASIIVPKVRIDVGDGATDRGQDCRVIARAASVPDGEVGQEEPVVLPVREKHRGPLLLEEREVFRIPRHANDLNVFPLAGVVALHVVDHRKRAPQRKRLAEVHPRHRLVDDRDLGR